MKEVEEKVYSKEGRLYTENSVPGEKVYGEEFRKEEGVEYREWVPERSKAAAAIKKGVRLGIREDSEILYLGAASGTTVSHFSDIVQRGFILAVEYSEPVARDLVKLSKNRENIAPVIDDARKPQNYRKYIEKVDIVYQDISQRDQAEIFLKNCRKFLKEDGVGLIAIKARSISSSKAVEEVFDEVEEKLRKEMKLETKERLEPYEKDHLFVKLKNT